MIALLILELKAQSGNEGTLENILGACLSGPEIHAALESELTLLLFLPLILGQRRQRLELFLFEQQV